MRSIFFCVLNPIFMISFLQKKTAPEGGFVE